MKRAWLLLFKTERFCNCRNFPEDGREDNTLSGWKQPRRGREQVTPLATDSDRNNFVTLTESKGFFPAALARPRLCKPTLLT
jgi:hypothetical protein